MYLLVVDLNIEYCRMFFRIIFIHRNTLYDNLVEGTSSFKCYNMSFYHFVLGNPGSRFNKVHVSLSGHDSKTCGSSRKPCRSLVQALNQVNWGGIIFLNGTGTEQRPYHCSHHGASDYHPGINITKSLSITSYSSVPRVSCIGGLYFQNTPENQQTLKFELSGIVFQQTSLWFEDYSNVKIFNCSFSDSSTALTVHVRKCSKVTLEIQGWSLFRNNSRCIQILLFDDITVQDRYVAINTTDTYFLENGYHSKGISDTGLINITADMPKPVKTIHLHVFFCRVICIGNRGSFINNNIPTAVTKEVYKNVQLERNKGNYKTSSFFSKRKPNNQIEGLYNSRAMKIFAQFIDVNCIHNTLLRCITVTANYAEIEIHTSQFSGQTVLKANGGCLSLESNEYLSLTISNSTFKRNKAKTGGAMSVNCLKGIVKLDFSNVNFFQCSSRMYGCAVTVGRNQKVPNELVASFRNVQVKRSNGIVSRGNCTSVYFLLKSGTVKIEKSTWSENSQAMSGALFVRASGGKVDVNILECFFLDNGPSEKRGAIISLLNSGKHSGNVTIMNTSLINKKERQNEAMKISAKYRIKLVNLTTAYYWKGLHVLLSPRSSNGAVHIYISNCKFVDNIMDVNIYLQDPASVRVIIKNTVLIGSQTNEVNFAVRVVIPALKKRNFSSAVIVMENNTFDSRPSSSFVLFFEGKKNVTIQQTTFRNCVCFHGKQWKKHLPWSKGLYETATGAISILTNPGRPLQFGCVQLDVNNDTHPLWSYDSHVLFKDTHFIDNLGLLVGGVYISNSNTTFNRCTFQDNFASQQAGHVYSAYGTGQVNFKDCSFKRQKGNVTINELLFDKAIFLNSESKGPVNFQNTTMVSTAVNSFIYTFSVLKISSGGYVRMDENTTIQCTRGYKLGLENNTHFVYTETNKTDCRMNVTALKYSCKFCPPGYYSLSKGVSRGLLVETTFRCLRCPFGANCVGRNIGAKRNFWGYKVSKNPQSLTFQACPEHYCKSPPQYTAEYNSCYGNRTGILCGECSPGYSETLFSTECRRNVECNNFWKWCLTMLLLTTGFVLYLLIKPPILSFLRNHIFWFRKSDEEEIRQNLGPVHEHSDTGYLKITFYFYQAAELLIAGSAEHLLHKIPFIYAGVAAFNFKVQSLNNGIGCPVPGITAVTKELLLSVPVVVTMAEVVILFWAHFLFNTVRRKRGPSVLHYMAVVLEILLLGYERLAETSLKLMHCVSINSEKRLLFNAEVLCWQWWQYFLMAYIGVFVAPFVAVLYFGSSKLCKTSISSREFFGACIFPLPFLVYWLIKRLLKKRGNIRDRIHNNNDVIKVLHGPFRQPNDHDSGTLYWESVLIARRLILLSCHAFIAISMFRMVCMTTACVIALLHHTLKNPYRDPMANKAETISLLALVIMAVINLTKATLNSFGTSFDGPARPYLETLEWAEVCALVFVPTLFSIFIIFAIFSQLVRLMVALGKSISCWVNWPHLLFPRELQRPLLDTLN